jgi:hypothetical protein
MRRLLALAPLALLSCAVEPPCRPVGGLTARLRVEKSAYVLWEQITFQFEVRNEGTAPVEFVPVHWWDRAYTWHRSKFEESEAMLVVETHNARLPKEATSASG